MNVNYIVCQFLYVQFIYKKFLILFYTITIILKFGFNVKKKKKMHSIFLQIKHNFIRNNYF